MIYVLVLLLAFSTPWLIQLGVMTNSGWFVILAALLAGTGLCIGMARVTQDPEK